LGKHAARTKWLEKKRVTGILFLNVSAAKLATCGNNFANLMQGSINGARSVLTDFLKLLPDPSGSSSGYGASGTTSVSLLFRYQS